MMKQQALLDTRCISSLDKVFADEDLSAPPLTQGTALWGETYSFQLAYRSNQLLPELHVRVTSELSDQVTVRAVGLVPSELPAYADADGHVLRTTPGLYPDPLQPLGAQGVRAYPGQWRTLWVSVSLPTRSDSTDKITYSINIEIIDEKGERRGGEIFVLDVWPAELPQQRLIHTAWCHYDCLATHYKVDVFSERHWEWIERYVDNAVAHGVNMLLTPLFTPPLDTAIGGERPTVQLVDVEVVQEGQYRFGFDKMVRWVDMCNRAGIRYYEFSHLFTQWGARHAPKIMATVRENGQPVQRRIFGWDTDATGAPYRQFLDQFLPALVRFIQEHRLEDRSYFHVSDEPNLDQLEDYRNASTLLKKHLAPFPFIEALSDYSFYEYGLVPNPIPANDHIEPFLDNKVSDLWTYYCCLQSVNVSNRFFNMPSARNRILGFQLYVYKIRGFLHWGYNFWYTQYSRSAIDPFKVTDAGGAFPSGDAFVVYPGEDGPIDSMRWEVFQEALQDLRACELLESLVGRDEVVKLLTSGLPSAFTFSEYPRDAGWLLAKREELNARIAQALGK